MGKTILTSGGPGFVGRHLPAGVAGGDRAATLMDWKAKITLEDGAHRVAKHAHRRLKNGFRAEL